MFKKLFPFVVLVVLAVMAAPALAQGGNPLDFDLPDTAAQAVVMLVEFVGVVAGVGSLTNILTDKLKDLDKKIFGVDILDEAQEIRISGLMAELTAFLLAAVLGWVAINYLQPWAAYLDSIGIWPVVVAGWAFARKIYSDRKVATKVAAA